MNLDRPYIIAEAGTCHTGNVNLAKVYVRAAYRAGADAVKFQMFNNPNPRTMFCWIAGDEGRAARWIKSALTLEEWFLVKKEADRFGIDLLFSAFEHETIKWQSELGVKATKVASRAAPYLEAFRDAPKPLLVSNGMTEVSSSADRIILQCEAKYPSTSRWTGDFPGFSDHSGTPWRAIDALARGCKLIEVHYYVNPSEAGPDYPASLGMEGLSLVCDARDGICDSL